MYRIDIVNSENGLDIIHEIYLQNKNRDEAKERQSMQLLHEIFSEQKSFSGIQLMKRVATHTTRSEAPENGELQNDSNNA